MRTILSTAILLAAAIPGAASAQAPVTPQRELSALLRQDASLRERIARIQLDALISRVDQTVGHRPRVGMTQARGDALRRDLDLYTF